MRVARIEIDGQEHLLCFSLRVLRAVCERYGGIEYLDAATSSEDQAHNLSEAVWQMATMMDAGDRYARERGLYNPSPLTEDQLLDLCTIYDFSKFRAKDPGDHHLRVRGPDPGRVPKRGDHAGGNRLNPAWFLWYGLQAGLPYQAALDAPFGEILDLMAIQQIKREGARERGSLTDEDIIPDVR